MAAVARSLKHSTTPPVRVEALTRRFGDRTILDAIDLTIDSGEFVALLGRSGSGKSTLLRALAEIDHDVSGEGFISVPLRRSVLFQDARLLPWATVLSNVVLGARDPDSSGRGRQTLAEVGLAGHEDAWPKTLSGGEQQRAALARSLVRNPELILADEPFGALDALTRLRMHELLEALCLKHSPAVLLVTHDVDEALALADRILVLDRGRFSAELPVELPRPRLRTGTRFVELRQEILTLLGV